MCPLTQTESRAEFPREFLAAESQDGQKQVLAAMMDRNLRRKLRDHKHVLVGKAEISRNKLKKMSQTKGIWSLGKDSSGAD